MRGDAKTNDINKTRPMVCDLCGSSKFNTHLDIGWDIWPGGEERQHTDRCLSCGAKRFWCDVIELNCEGV